MIDPCRQFEEWLDAAEPGPLSGDLQAHAATCETCGRRRAIDRAIRTGLAGGATLDAARQRTLVDRIAEVSAKQQSPVLPSERSEPTPPAVAGYVAREGGSRNLAVRTTACPNTQPDRATSPGMRTKKDVPVTSGASVKRGRKWPWVAGAAATAAAVVLGICIFRPEHRQPVSVSPTQVFADLLGPLADFTPPPPQAAAPADTNSSPLGPVLAAMWGDFEAPLNVGLDAIKAPQVVAPGGKGPAPAPAALTPAVKKEG